MIYNSTNGPAWNDTCLVVLQKTPKQSRKYMQTRRSEAVLTGNNTQVGSVCIKTCPSAWSNDTVQKETMDLCCEIWCVVVLLSPFSSRLNVLCIQTFSPAQQCGNGWLFQFLHLPESLNQVCPFSSDLSRWQVLFSHWTVHSLGAF